mgnify:CR=1 FL=1
MQRSPQNVFLLRHHQPCVPNAMDFSFALWGLLQRPFPCMETCGDFLCPRKIPTPLSAKSPWAKDREGLCRASSDAGWRERRQREAEGREEAKARCPIRSPAGREEGKAMSNPRYANGALRRKHRARLKAMRCECGICHGRFGPIHYEEPSDAQHPLSFVVDEIRPVSRWKQFGYPSARAAAEDWTNLQAAHYFCNAQKGNKIESKQLKMAPKLTKIPKISDGDW